MERKKLSGCRIMVVEDEYYLADDLAQALRNEGAEVVGPAANVSDADRLVSGEAIDCAVLDINLRGDSSAAIADRIEAVGIPYCIATGYSSGSLPDRFSHVPLLEKPAEAQKIVDMVVRLLGKYR